MSVVVKADVVVILLHYTVEYNLSLKIQAYAYFAVYGLEVCALDKGSIQSLDFTVNRFFMELIKTSDITVVRECQSLFGFDPQSVALCKRFDKFIARCESCCMLYQ